MANREFTLTTGRELRLVSLDQFRFYGQFLAGYPTRARNERWLKRLLEKAREKHSMEPYLVPPSERPVPPSALPSPDPEAVMLPRIVCVAFFSSDRPARDSRRDGSALPVLWLQEDFAFPIDPRVEEHLRALPWERLAVDGDD